MEQKKKQFDVVIIGAGIAGLSCAIKLKQKALEEKSPFTVAIVEKSGQIGSHILSGAIVESSALEELIPNWQDKKTPLENKVTQDKAILITEKTVIPFLKPKGFSNKNHYMISLGELCEWLAEEALTLGVNIFTKTAALELLYDDSGAVIGVATSKDILIGKQIVIAEGANGFLAKQIVKQHQLDKDVKPQRYSVGFKEIWQVEAHNFAKGLAVDFFTKTKDNQNYLRGFIHHVADNSVAIGATIALDYQNPYLDPFQEFQNLKEHSQVKELVAGGIRKSYGAKVIPIGGYDALPKLSFNGGVIIGDSAGLLNNFNFKAISNNIISGILAADVIFNHIKENQTGETNFDQKIRQAPFMKDLYRYRNCGKGFKYGLIIGVIWFLIDCYMVKGKINSIAKTRYDYQKLKKAKKHLKINYTQDDGILTFDKLSSAYLTGIRYAKNALSHLEINDIAAWLKLDARYDSLAARYCPSSVYEIISENNEDSLKINFTNCINCQICELKDPAQLIKCYPQAEGDGTNYQKM